MLMNMELNAHASVATGVEFHIHQVVATFQIKKAGKV
jgi:hypothetical protein